MVKTHGLSHVALSVLDPDRSLAFYSSVFGVREYFRDESTIQVLGPGQYDVLAFERRPALGRHAQLLPSVHCPSRIDHCRFALRTGDITNAT
jgi:catechol 2,3-dioxygenase-like lactoylglutathione lyase family enzyme